MKVDVDEAAVRIMRQADAEPSAFNGTKFTIDEYQAFLDYHPVSRFNQESRFSRVTKEGGRHFFPAMFAKRLPALIDRFDWVLVGGNHSHYRSSDPNTVWACANAPNVRYLLRRAESEFDSARSDRVLILGDSDAWLSDVLGDIPGRPPPERSDETVAQNPALLMSKHIEAYSKKRADAKPVVDQMVARLRKFFNRIFFEAKDMKIEGIRTMPIGLTEFFLRNGVAEAAAAAIASARLDAKPGAVKGAFSFYHDLAHCDRGWGQGQALRLEAKAWSRSEAASNAGVNFDFVEPTRWWSTVSQYKFLMTPNGCGVQTPKQMEALWVLTVPIARRGPFPVWDDLVQYGFPMVVVDEWDEINPTNLSRWWQDLSPRLEGFRKRCLTTDGYWRLFTGQSERCE